VRPKAGATIALLVALETALSALTPAAALATTPAAPTLSSTSHQVSAWSRDNTVDLTWSAGVPVNGFGYDWQPTDQYPASQVIRIAGEQPGMTSQPPGDGYWYFILNYQDTGGSWSESARLGPFLIDTTAPYPGSLRSDYNHPPGDTPSRDNRVGISWSAASDSHPNGYGSTSGAAGLSYQWDASGSPVVPDMDVDTGPGQGGTSSGPLPDGIWYFYVRAVDNAGNWGNTASIGPFVIAAGPTVQIDEGPEQDSTGHPSSVEFEFSADDPNATFECRLDSASFAACSSPRTVSGMSNGFHTFEVRGKNALGNTGSSDYRQFWVGFPPTPPPPWTAETVTAAGTPYAPSIAYDPAGKLHVAYLIEVGSSKGLYYATNKSGTWQTAKIGSATGNDEWTSIAVDSLGKVHVAYQKFGRAIYYLTNASGSWVTKNIRSSPGFAVYPEIAVDSLRKVHIVYFVPSSTSPGLRYSTNAGGSWVTKRLTKSSFDVYADVAVDASRRIHVLYGRSTNAKGYRYATNRSGTWKDSSALSGVEFVRQPSLEFDSHGAPLAAIAVNGRASTTAMGLWIMRKTSSGWNKLKLSDYPPLHAQVGVTPDGFEHVVGYSGGPHWSNETGSWQSENAATSATFDRRAAFDVGPSGQLAVAYVTSDFHLGITVRPAAE
jgi:hypothetical protein